MIPAKNCSPTSERYLVSSNWASFRPPALASSSVTAKMFFPVLGSFRETWICPEHPGSYVTSPGTDQYSDLNRYEHETGRLTVAQGFAIKVGMIPYLIPTLFASNLYSTALSAIFLASV